MTEEFFERLKPHVAPYLPAIEGESFEEYIARAALVPVFGKRALIAAAIKTVSDEMKGERRAKKGAWIDAARLSFDPGYRKPCFVCGKFKSITQAHHVVPLSSQYDRGFPAADGEHEWLCPNHHAILHLILPSDGSDDNAKVGRRAAGPILDLEQQEIEIMFDLLRRAGRGLE